MINRKKRTAARSVQARKAKKRTTKKAVRTTSASIRVPKKSAARPTVKKASKKPSSKSQKSKKKKSNKKPIGTCFVLMPFKEPFDTYYSAIIRPAIISLRLEAQRGDSLFRPSPIMGDVWEMIQNAKVLLAELTEKNANVFYELGLAHAIGKPIVLLSETIDDVPFDLQPLRVILYDKDDPAWGVRLRSAIGASLSETLADPTNAVPPMFRKKVKSQAPEENEALLRLSVLEREVASLRSGGGSRIQEPWRSSDRRVDVLRSRILHRENSKEAVQAAMMALKNGVQGLIVRQTIRRSMPQNEAQEIIDQIWSGVPSPTGESVSA